MRADRCGATSPGYRKAVASYYTRQGIQTVEHYIVHCTYIALNNT